MSTTIGFIAGFLTMIAFLPQIFKTLRLKETKDISLGLCVFNALAGTLWLSYGVLKADLPLIIPNAIALSFGLTFLFLKLKYRSSVGSKEAAVLAAALLATAVGLVVTAFTPLSLLVFVGSSAIVFGPLSFLTQVAKTVKLKETKDISLLMYVIFWTGVVLWLTYGILRSDGAVIVNNIIMLTLTSAMLFFKLKYK